jgi:DNA repair exonuclease SbcCD ATPase subunit
MAKIRERRRVAGELLQAQSRREDNEWSLENADEEGLCAQAVFQYLQENEGDEVQTEVEVDRLRELKERRGNIYYDQEQGNDSEELQDELDSIDAEIEEIEEKIDVYALIPGRYSFYGKMRTYEIYQGNLYGNTYAASTESDAEDAALDYAKEYVDENGTGGFNRNFWIDHLDEEGILDYFRDFYEDDVRNNPDSYFNEDDFELTSEQEARKEQLENYIEEMESMLSDLEEEQRNLEDSDSDEYYDLDEKIQEVQSNIETAQTELDGIEPDTEPTDEMIDNKVDDFLEDVKYDYKAKLDEFGMDVSDWIDKDSLAQAFVDQDGIGIMNSYDGTYDTVSIDDETYVVMRLD